MRVTVKLHGESKRLIKGFDGDSLAPDIAPGATVGQLLEQLGVEPGDVWMSAVNKTVVKSDHVLQSGDAVEVFAPVSGGAPALI
jgi:sulfur carrier protein ThiS